MKLITVVGARPNFIKVAPLHQAFAAYPAVESKLVHTGQHHDAQMSDVFFGQLDLPQPDYHLGVGSGTPTQQTADIMLRFEEVITIEQPDWVVVVGDVTSTLACALAAAKMHIRVAHVEAGLRSGDRGMPEEINRILTDSVAQLLFVTEQAGHKNLLREGVDPQRIHFVGNVMIDSLVKYRPMAAELNVVHRLQLTPGEYVFMTMHRAANVDSAGTLQRILQIIANTAAHKTVVFPLHPRTEANLIRFALLDQLRAIPNVRLLQPQGYLECLNLMEHAAITITDSGGIQEETTYLQVPCLTFRSTTERPVTTTLGTNQLLSDLSPETVQQRVAKILAGDIKRGQIPPRWDGKAAERIAAILSVTA
ncbi:non-hydrolyzing UDP-N-acetylglucosamine 2-epimerase [Spirosoma fluminis]